MCENGKLKRQTSANTKSTKQHNKAPLFQPQDCSYQTGARHMSYHAFCKTIRNHCQRHSVISPLYALQDSIQQFIKERKVAGQQQYMITWAATNMLRKHLPLLKAIGYQIAKAEKCQEICKLFGPKAGRLR